MDCLDSWAVLRWLEGVEPGTRRVEEALQHRPVMSWINLGEVFYIVTRAAGEPAAQEVVNDLRTRLLLDEATPRRTLEAAALKAAHPMAYADAFAVATARAHAATLLTGDPEILGGPPDWAVDDLRSR